MPIVNLTYEQLYHYMEKKFCRYIEKGYTTCLTEDSISILFDRMEILKIDKHGEICKICCRTAPLSVIRCPELDPVTRVQAALEHVQQCFKLRARLLAERQCPVCIKGWNQISYADESYMVPKMTSYGHLESSFHLTSLERMQEYNAYDLAYILELHENAKLSVALDKQFGIKRN